MAGEPFDLIGIGSGPAGVNTGTVPSKTLRETALHFSGLRQRGPIGQGCLHYCGTLDYFIQSVFDYPTPAEAYKYAAYDGLGNLAQQKAAGRAEPG